MGWIKDFWYGAPSAPAQELTTRATFVTPNVDIAAPTMRTNKTPSSVSVDEALTVPAVYRCINTISTMIASLTVDAVRGGQALKTQPAIIRKPNLDMSRRAFVYDTACSMATYGEFFWYHPRTSPLETPKEMWVLNPNNVQVELDALGRRVYRRLMPDGKFAEVPTLHITHELLTRLPGQLRGRGPIQTAPAVIRGAIMLEDYVGNWWDDNEIPEGMLTTDQEVYGDQAKQLSEEWKKARQEHRTPFMGKGTKYEVLDIDPAKALYVEATKTKVVQIALLWGIPASILDAPSGDSAVYANQRDKHQAFLSYTLRSYLDPIESAWGELLPIGTFARFATDELLRMDEAGRAAFYGLAIDKGWMTIPEVREREGLPSLEPPTDPNAQEGDTNVG